MKPNTYELLKEELSADEPSRRYEAAVLIGNCEDMLEIPKSQELLEMLFPLLQDGHNHVRYYAIEAVGKFMSRDSIPHLKESMATLSAVRFPANEGITEAKLAGLIETTIALIVDKGNAQQSL